MKFDMTPEGYVAAVEYLKESNQYHLIEHEQSVDGYTVVALANKLWENKLIEEIVSLTSEIYDLSYAK